MLHAVYYDTPGLDLAARHITLRRRTGGTDASWHLKLPAELRDIVLAIVRDRPLVAAARIATSRTIDVLYGSDGTALAEFSDDHVSASADGEDIEQRWREWELELAEDAIARGSADEQLLARLSKPAARCRCGTCGACVETGAGARLVAERAETGPGLG